MYSLLLRIGLCLCCVGLTLYKYIDKLNELAELKLAIPILAKEVKEIHEKNICLQYEIACFESPSHLIELARKPEFGHLKYPTADEVIVLPDQSR